MSTENTAATVNTRELEKQIYAREGIAVVLRCPEKTQFKPWPYQRAMQDKLSLAKFRDERLEPHLRENSHSKHAVDFMIIKTPVDELTNAGRWKLGNLRELIKKTVRCLAEAV